MERETQYNMRLVIQNIHKVIDSEFHQGRFVCTKADETMVSYRFQFCDHNWSSARYVWIEISRNSSERSIGDKKNMYKLNYPNCKGHYISADFLSFKPNVIHLFELCLKECM